jgi:hypothetical protein
MTNLRETMASTERATEPHGEAEETCGQELARDAEVPESLSRLMAHVVKNMDAHARWVGASPAGAREQAALERVATAYRALAAAAAQAAAAMRDMKDLPPAPHDPTKWDRAAQARWMREKIALQRDFAALILRHAQASEAALAALEAPSPPARPQR